jgi:hypothetical protein
MRYIAVGAGSVAALDAAVSPPQATEWRIPVALPHGACQSGLIGAQHFPS